MLTAAPFLPDHSERRHYVRPDTDGSSQSATAPSASLRGSARPRSYEHAASCGAFGWRQSYAGVMIRPSSDGSRLTAHLEPGGPCIAVAEHQPDGRWLVNGRAMSREHADVALEAAVTVAAASRHPHATAQMPAAVPLTDASAGPGATTGQIIP
jgi:hypothetical protein